MKIKIDYILLLLFILLIVCIYQSNIKNLFKMEMFKGKSPESYTTSLGQFSNEMVVYDSKCCNPSTNIPIIPTQPPLTGEPTPIILPLIPITGIPTPIIPPLIPLPGVPTPILPTPSNVPTPSPNGPIPTPNGPTPSPNGPTLTYPVNPFPKRYPRRKKRRKRGGNNDDYDGDFNDDYDGDFNDDDNYYSRKDYNVTFN